MEGWQVQKQKQKRAPTTNNRRDIAVLFGGEIFFRRKKSFSSSPTESFFASFRYQQRNLHWSCFICFNVKRMTTRRELSLVSVHEQPFFSMSRLRAIMTEHNQQEQEPEWKKESLWTLLLLLSSFLLPWLRRSVFPPRSFWPSRSGKKEAIFRIKESVRCYRECVWGGHEYLFG